MVGTFSKAWRGNRSPPGPIRTAWLLLFLVFVKSPSIRAPLCRGLPFLVCGLLVCAPALGQGIAQNYPGDVGIEQHPAVIFTENFEAATLNDVFSGWNTTQNGAGMSFMTDIPADSSGIQSLEMTVTGGENTGGYLYRTLAGYDTVYVRYYVKFPVDTWDIHHFVWLGGYNPSTPWPQGGAGVRPDGDERFTSGIEPSGGGRWDFYTYWMGMHASPGGNFFGNDFNPDPPVPVVEGDWTCVEFMIKLNEPVTASNGEQAFWIDGVLGQQLGPGFPNGNWVWGGFFPDPSGEPFEGFQWRNTSDLDINFLWLEYYVTTAPSGATYGTMFDDIVLATEYIGCLQPDSTDTEAPDPPTGLTVQ